MDTIMVGIDLGLYNTVVCCRFGNKSYRILRVDSGKKILPSVIYVMDDGSVLVGAAAKNARTVDPANGISLAECWRKKQTVVLRGREFSAMEIMTEILAYVAREIVDRFLVKNISAAIVIPGDTRSVHKKQIKQVAKMVGLRECLVISKPIALATAEIFEIYGNLRADFLIVDFGQTLEFAAVKKDGYEWRMGNVGGCRTLGIDNFDRAVYEYFLFRIQDDIGLNLSRVESSGLDYREYAMINGRLLSAAREAREHLCEDSETNHIIEIASLIPSKEQYIFHVTLTRDKFDELCANVYGAFADQLRRFVESCHFSDSYHLMVIGDGGYIHRIRQIIAEVTGKMPLAPKEYEYALNELAAYGACSTIFEKEERHAAELQAAMLQESLAANQQLRQENKQLRQEAGLACREEYEAKLARRENAYHEELDYLKMVNKKLQREVELARQGI